MTFKSKKRAAAPAVAPAPAAAVDAELSDDEPAVILNRKRPWHVIRQGMCDLNASKAKHSSLSPAFD
jgi:hypothetical protein